MLKFLINYCKYGLILFMAASPIKINDHNHFNIIVINSVKEMVPYFNKFNQDTLIVFDIDSTLTIPSDRYLQRKTIKKYKSIYEKFISRLTENQYRIFLHLIVIDSGSILIEPEISSIIQGLQHDNIKIIGFTASKFGALGDLPSFPEWRYQELKRLGIDFSIIFPGQAVFSEFVDLNEESVGIAKGIVYSGYKNSKGSLLKKTLEKINFYPKQIVFIDDKKTNLISLLEASKIVLPGAYSVGFHYNAVELLPTFATQPQLFERKIDKLIKKTYDICP